MAMTSAEKMTKYRQRLKEAGGKTFAINIAGKRLEWVSELAKLTETGQTEADVLRKVVEGAIDQRIDIYHRAVQIRALGGSLEQIEQFYKDCRLTIPDISNYLPESSQ